MGESTEPTWRKRSVLAVPLFGLGMVVLRGTIVDIAMPDSVHDLKMDLTGAQRANLYAVVLAASLLSTGSLSDR